MSSTLQPIPLEPLTAAAFAPFGHLVTQGEGEPAFATATIASWPIPVEVDDRLHMMWSWYPKVAMTFDRLERHVAVSQGFLPVGDLPSVMVVAPGGAEREPAPHELRAFLVPGDVGIVLARNTWHALTRFPVRNPGGAFVLLTSAATQAELEEERRTGAKPTLTHVLDYAARGTSFAVSDPRGLLTTAHRQPAG
jgi:ureidoglycolate lyase